MDRLNQSTVQRGRPVSSVDAAKASDVLEHFINSGTLKTILGNYRTMCELLHLKPNVFPLFYPKLKANLNSWKAKALWKKFDARASHKCYARGKICPNTRVLIIGAGPCGLRTAIEAQLLGAKVVVIEKRDRMSRNNVLHLWPFVIEDLRALGAKKFFGKFCAGAIDHISIRQLQCILLKVALLLGVEVYTEVSFERLIEPNGTEKTGWRAEFKPTDHPVSQYEFDVIIGADGKRNTLQGFKRKEFRGKLAIAITANFINKRTEAEARVEEISGVAFIFNQKFFKELNAETGIDLENIVYYKDDTHYFVMTAKKISLIDKGVIIQDYADTARLLSPDNVNREALMNYAREAADFSTNYQMPDLEFAVNHYGQPDVAMFDFTSMYAAENASKVIERHGYKLLMILVGDSLLEPFWPTGSGCARGFLSSLDACWAIKAWGSGLTTPLEILAERESIYRLLAQTTPENLNKDCKAYTVDPSTRYPNLNRAVLVPQQVLSLYDTDDPTGIELTSRIPQPVTTCIETHRKRRRRDMHLDPNTLINWIKEQVKEYEELTVEDLTTSFKDGRVLCAILHHYRPDLLDYSAVKSEDVAKNNQLAFDLLEKEIGIPPVMTGDDMDKAEVPDYLTMFSYLTLIYDTFRGEIPHIKHPKLSSSPLRKKSLPKPKAPDFIPLFHHPLLDHAISSNNQNITDGGGENSSHKYLPTLNKKTMVDINSTKSRPDVTKMSIINSINSEISESHESNLEFVHGKSTFDVVLRSGEENCEAIDIKELNYSTRSNLMTINKPRRYLKWKKRLGKSVGVNKKQKTSNICHSLAVNKLKFSYLRNMSAPDLEVVSPDVIYHRIRTWLNRNDFKQRDDISDMDSDLLEKLTDITSITRNILRENAAADSKHDEIKVTERTEEVKFTSGNKNGSLVAATTSLDSIALPMDKLNSDDLVQFSHETSWNSAAKKLTVSEPALKFSPINESEETDLPDANDGLKETAKIGSIEPVTSLGTMVPRHNTRSKRYADFISSTKANVPERKTKKRRSFEKYDLGVEERCKRLEEIAANRADRQNKRRHQRKMQTEQFIKSMQMLQMNGKSDASGPFEDYSIFVYRQTAPHFQDRVKNLEKQFTYVPDRENRMPNQSRGGGAEEQVAATIKDLQDKWRHPEPVDKKPKDLRRAIGKIETSDWNIKEIEKKILENKMGKSVNKEKERIPKWNQEQFLARQTKLEKLDRQNSAEAKYSEPDKGIKHLEQRFKLGSVRGLGQTKVAKIMEKLIHESKSSVPKHKAVQKHTPKPAIALPTQGSGFECCSFCHKPKYSELDKGIKHLEQRLKEGSVRDLGQNKVATITEKLIPKSKSSVPKLKAVQKHTPKLAIALPTQGSGSEYCHFCHKRVYLMERLSAEGRFFHRGCFKCQYCHTTLRLGSYMFDRDGIYGHRFYCSQHFGMSGELYPNRTEHKTIQKEHIKPLEKIKIIPLTGVEGVDLLDRVQTPERIEFANLSTGHVSSDHDESLSQMDEDEWTDRNFGASTAEVCTSNDEDSSSLSGSESDNEDAFEEALEEPPTKEGTLRWMERYKQRYSKERRKADDSDSEDYSSSTDHSSYYENSSGDEEDEPATEGEEEIRARELRKQEVRVEPPVVQTDTGSDTEIVSDESSPESSSKHNSATEISTDSEFAVDEPTPTREIPSIVFNDFHITKSRGNYGPPKKVQVKSAVLQSPLNGKTQKSGIKLEFTPLVPSPVLPKPATTSLLNRTEGYALNRTQSTGGIATKVSLELKKKYLLGDSGVPGTIQKSGSVSTLDSKFKSFHTNISDCQKLLKPAQEVGTSTQVFSTKLNEQRISPLSPIISQSSPFSDQSPDVVNPIERKSIDIIDLTGTSPDVTKISREPTEKGEEQAFEHELEGRPRSPVQEIPIIVPKIDWSLTNRIKGSNISSDSLTSDSDSEEHTGIQKLPSVKAFENIPRVEVHNDIGEILQHEEIPLDSLCPTTQETKVEKHPITTLNDAPKSAPSDRKSLNQPKILPDLQDDHVHEEFHEKAKTSPEICLTNTSSGQSTSSDHDSYVEHTGAAMTETELSDWARDDYFDDVEFDLNRDFVTTRKNKLPKNLKSQNQKVIKANMEEFDEFGHVCGKEKQIHETQIKNSFSENLSNLLNSLEFMDTGEETSSDEKVLVEATMKNNGYVEFQNEDDVVEDSLNPSINNVIETINPEIRENLSTYQNNTGYCIIGNEDNFGGTVIDLKENDLEKLKEKQKLGEHEEDSLLVVETGTTTEENTCSDSTVKNLVEEKERKNSLNVESLIKENKTLLEKIRSEHDSNKQERSEYEEHCKRLQSKVEFGNVRDSIDIRKSKRKDKSELPTKPDLILEETLSPVNTIQTTPTVPTVIYTKEGIKKVRDENQKLVQEMVMNKMKAENRSLERKRRSRNSFSPSLSPSRPFDLTKSATTDLSPQPENKSPISKEKPISTNISSTPDVLLCTNDASSNLPDKSLTNELNTPTSSIKQHPKSFTKQLSIHSSFLAKEKPNRNLPDTPLTNPEAYSLPDIQQALLEFKTPRAPPRQKSEEARKTVEKLKQDARLRVRLKSNEDLGLSPEDKLLKLRERINKRPESANIDVHILDSIESLVINTERRNSLLYSNDTLTKKRNNSFKRSKSGEDYPKRTKSVSEISKSFTDAKLMTVDFDDEMKNKQLFCKSDPNLLMDACNKTEKKLKVKDRERRKSITKLISEFFGKKKENVKNSTTKGFLARLSPKSKSKDKHSQQITRTNSFSETQLRRSENVSPPPIPPLPLNYTGSGPSRCTDDSSDGDKDWKRHERSSCDTLDQSGMHEGRRVSRTARRASRQAQLKRHRMAQEIQRKLEETEVKTKELEQRGVNVEKTLRGECCDGYRDKDESESDLLKEWFDLMRDLTELRRYERELMVKAQELELEDRHARLQQELRERLENEEHKTKEDVKVESNIINEMMEIVAKRDALIVLLDQDRLRYSVEDRDFEEQLLGKVLKSSPLQKKCTK